MILLIDNFDSFTFNLVQVFQQLHADPVVLRNDEPEILNLATHPDLTGLVVSPGPGGPEDTGLCREALKIIRTDLPVMGVCLGHQLLGYLGGAKVERADRIMHGKTSLVHHDGTGLFQGLPNPMEVCRYHSLLVKPGAKKLPFRVTATTDEGEVMGLAYTDRPWVGVQFHPESILTPDGPKLIANFLALCEHQKSVSKGRAKGAQS